VSASPNLKTNPVIRTLDASRLNGVANHPDVRPWLGGIGELDLSEVVSSPSNFAFEVEGGGFLCIARAPGLYEVHSLFLPDARAGRTYPAMVSAMTYMFTQTDCVELVTRVPDNNERAASLAKAGGFTCKFRREASWPDGETLIGASYLSLSVDAWALASVDCRDVGHVFHDMLEAAKAETGSDLLVHADDAAHDAMVGASVLMAQNGNPAKGVAFYNRWASYAGYSPATLLSVNPPVVDVVDAVVEAGPAGMEVLLCR
jgi:hypothetical protein